MSAVASNIRVSQATLLALSVTVLLVAGTLTLWAYYGTTVFFEMVRNGWAACF